LTSMYFLGDLPSSLGNGIFTRDNSLTSYYLDGATGWSSTVRGRPAQVITAGTTGVASITAFSDSNKTAAFSIADNSYTNVELVVLNGSSGVTSGKAFALSGDNWTVTSPALVKGDVVKVFLQTSSGATVTQLLSYSYDRPSQYYSVDLGVGIVSIDNSVFRDCSELTTVIIGANVTSIGYAAFHSCSKLTAVTIGANVTSIGDAAFYSCSKLTAVIIGANVTSIGDGAFYSCSKLTAVTIPDAVTSIGQSAFISCSKLTAVTIGSGLTTMGGSAFQLCSELTAVIIPNSVTSIGSNAFQSCSKLTAVIIPDAVTSIGASAFQSCSELTAVTIGASVTTIGDGAFYSCSKLTAVTISSVNTTFFNSLNDEVYQISGSTVSLFFCPRDKTTFTIPDSVTSNPNVLSRVYTVTSIDINAFDSCFELTAVTIGANVTTIDNGAFQDCSSLTSLPVSPDNTVLYNDPSDNGVIYQISNGVASLYLSVPTKVSYEMLSTIQLSTIQTVDVTSVHSYAFYYDASLSHIVLSDSITQIGESAFQGCTGLSNVVIPANVTTIDTRAFVNDSALTSVYFLGAKPNIYTLNITTATGSTIGLVGGANENDAFYNINVPSTAYYLSSNVATWHTKPRGFTNLEMFTIYDLRVAGYTASELQTLGVSDIAILGAGYSATDLKTAGYSISDLREALYSDSDILGAGYTALDLKNAGYTATQLLNAGYSISDLREALYSDSDILGAGYTALDLKNAGYTALDLKNAGYTATQLLNAGYSASAILGAGYSATELAAAGFYLISGTATGISTGATFILTLSINGDSVETKTIQATSSDNINFYFINYVSDGSTYGVTITTQPQGKTGTVSNGSGTINGSNINNISIAFTENSSSSGSGSTPTSNVCFPAKTPILTNCGPINIEDIDPAVHTIRNKKIVAITKTVAHDKNLVRIAKHALGHLYPEKPTLISQNHKVFFQGQMVKAKHLVDEARGVTLVPYKGETLYNVLLEQYEKMQVNNLIVETLHPEHKVAKLYRFLQNVDAAHHGKLIALFNQKDREQRLRR